MTSSWQRLSGGIFYVFMNFLIGLLVALTGENNCIGTVWQPKAEATVGFANKRANSTQIDRKFSAIVINFYPGSFKIAIGGFFEVIENLLVSIRISLGIEDNRLTAIRQPKCEPPIV